MNRLLAFILLCVISSKALGQDSTESFMRMQFRSGLVTYFWDSKLDNGQFTDDIITEPSSQSYFIPFEFYYFVSPRVALHIGTGISFDGTRNRPPQSFINKAINKNKNEYDIIRQSQYGGNIGGEIVKIGADYRVQRNKFYYIASLDYGYISLGLNEANFDLKLKSTSQYNTLSYSPTEGGSNASIVQAAFALAYQLRGRLYAYGKLNAGTRWVDFSYTEELNNLWLETSTETIYPYKKQQYFGGVELGLLLDIHRVYKK